jgi:general secretion pathway protein I
MVRRARTRPGRIRGFALIDVIVGGVILGIGLAAVLSIAERSLAMQQRSERELVASQLLDGLLNEVLATGPVDWMAQKPSDGHFDAPFEAWQWQLEIRKQELGDPYRVHAVVRDEHGVQFEIETQMAPRLSDAEEPDRRPQTPIDRQSRYDQQKQ